ncbi:MAG: hypothetical protein KGL39_42455 [Patescibacteria group bacterium]|nr:hypothetical protein [Patescibacteria group bacterium]
MQEAALEVDGWTALELFYSNTQGGSYATTGQRATLGTYTTANSETVYQASNFLYTFTWASGNPAQWFKVVAWNGSQNSSLDDASEFHGGGGTTLATIRQRLLTEIRDGWTVTATGASTTSATITSPRVVRFASSNYFNNWFFHDVTQGAWTQVSASSVSSGTLTLTLSPALGSAVASGDNCELSRRFTPDELNDAINWAAVEAYPAISRVIINTANMTSQQIYQYGVPNDMKSILSVEIESAANAGSTVMATRGHPYTQVPYKILKEGPRQTIEIKRQYSANRRLRMIGLGLVSPMAADADYCEVIDPQINVLIYYAAARLFDSYQADAASTDIARYAQLAQQYHAKADKARTEHGSGRMPKRMWAYEQMNSSAAWQSGIGSWNTSVS